MTSRDRKNHLLRVPGTLQKAPSVSPLTDSALENTFVLLMFGPGPLTRRQLPLLSYRIPCGFLFPSGGSRRYFITGTNNSNDTCSFLWALGWQVTRGRRRGGNHILASARSPGFSKKAPPCFVDSVAETPEVCFLRKQGNCFCLPSSSPLLYLLFGVSTKEGTGQGPWKWLPSLFFYPHS